MPIRDTGATPAAISGVPTFTVTKGTTTPAGVGQDAQHHFTITLTRNGATAAVNCTWAVAGSGSMPAPAGAFAGGAYPAGSGSIAGATTTVDLVAGSATGAPAAASRSPFRPQPTLGTAGAADVLTGHPTTASLLTSSRFNAMGYGADSGSDGSGEEGGANAYTAAVAIEYPTGMITLIQFGGVRSHSVVIGANDVSDKLTLPTAIPDGAQYWLRTYV